MVDFFANCVVLIAELPLGFVVVVTNLKMCL